MILDCRYNTIKYKIIIFLVFQKQTLFGILNTVILQ